MARDDDYCYLTTTGRTTGRPHRIEIWYAEHVAGGRRTLYLLAGGRHSADWVRNAVAHPAVRVELDGIDHPATARVIDDADEQERARSLVFDKYQPRDDGDLSGWRESALPVALDL